MAGITPLSLLPERLRLLGIEAACPFGGWAGEQRLVLRPHRSPECRFLPRSFCLSGFGCYAFGGGQVMLATALSRETPNYSRQPWLMATRLPSVA
jgi:hypothetical protein